MGLYGRHTVNIERCDNGFIVEWSVPESEWSAQTRQATGHQSKTSGREVFTDLKKAMKYAEAKMI